MSALRRLHDAERHPIVRYGQQVVDNPASLLARPEINVMLPRWGNGADGAFYAREVFIRRFSFAIPCREAVDAIASRSSAMVEIGAGTGFWTRVLGAHGIDVVATDIAKSGAESNYLQRVGHHAPVEKLTAATAVRRFRERDILVIWPSYDDPWAYRAIRHAEPGRLIVYIGEGRGGCTGCDHMHDFLEEQCERLDGVGLPQFDGIHDHLSFYRRT